MEANSEASYCDADTWEDWQTHSSVSLHTDEQTPPRQSEDSVRLERDALLRALHGERSRAAAVARAHDARLAELHGVIAELVRRRDEGRQSRAIAEENSGSEECESTTQPACDLDNDADKTENSSSVLSPAELPTPHEPKPAPALDKCVCQHNNVQISIDRIEDDLKKDDHHQEHCNMKHNKDCNDRCCHLLVNCNRRTNSSCSREQGSLEDGQAYVPGKCEPRHAKLASRVCLKKTEETFKNIQLTDENWSAQVAEKLALDVGAQADLREALISANTDTNALTATLVASRARVSRLEADNRVLECALSRAINTAQRLSMCCGVHESASVSLCTALSASDRALETYDVLLALAETAHCAETEQRAAAELIAKRLLHRLDTESDQPDINEPLVPPGPWITTNNTTADGVLRWDSECEQRLRAHAARLKTETVTLRDVQPQPKLFSYHDAEDEDPLPSTPVTDSAANMEMAVLMQEVAASREEHAHLITLLYAERARNKALAKTLAQAETNRKHRERHWLDAAEPNETEL